jgi:hypothetical protein
MMHMMLQHLVQDALCQHVASSLDEELHATAVLVLLIEQVQDWVENSIANRLE